MLPSQLRVRAEQGVFLGDKEAVCDTFLYLILIDFISWEVEEQIFISHQHSMLILSYIIESSLRIVHL